MRRKEGGQFGSKLEREEERREDEKLTRDAVINLQRNFPFVFQIEVIQIGILSEGEGAKVSE